AFSDMGGYLDRANAILDDKWHAPPLHAHPKLVDYFDWVAGRVFGKKAPHLTLYPPGTHAFVAVVKLLFGKTSRVAIGVTFALLGTLAVSYSYATAARFSPNPRVRRVVAVILVLYYPWISLGGYALSETPFTLCVAASAYHGLALADRGRRRDAWLLGL